MCRCWIDHHFMTRNCPFCLTYGRLGYYRLSIILKVVDGHTLVAYFDGLVGWVSTILYDLIDRSVTMLCH